MEIDADWGLGVSLVLGMLVFMFTSILPIEIPITLFQVLVIAQASLLAIVVSVGLLSLQISADQYTPLIARIYRRGYLKKEIGLFGVSIFVSLFALLLWAFINPQVFQNILTGAAVGLASGSFWSIFLVKDKMISRTSPEEILDHLLEEVSIDDYEEYAQKMENQDLQARSPFIEIVQICKKSFENGDEHTGVYSIITLRKASKKLIDQHLEESDQEINIRDLVFHWDQFREVVAEDGSQDAIKSFSESIVKVSEKAVEEDVDYRDDELGISSTTVYVLSKFTKNLLENNDFVKDRYPIELFFTEIAAENPLTLRNSISYTHRIPDMVDEYLESKKHLENPNKRYSYAQDAEMGLYTKLADIFEEMNSEIRPDKNHEELDKYHKASGDIIDSFEKYISKRHDSPDYMTVINSNLSNMGVSASETASELENDWTGETYRERVTTISRMIIEASVLTNTLTDKDLMNADDYLEDIIEAGGEEAVKEAIKKSRNVKKLEDARLEDETFELAEFEILMPDNADPMKELRTKANELKDELEIEL